MGSYTPCPRCGQALELSPGARDEIERAVRLARMDKEITQSNAAALIARLGEQIRQLENRIRQLEERIRQLEAEKGGIGR